MVKKRGLGKSLDALLSYTSNEVGQGVSLLESDTLIQLPIHQLIRGKYQPRQEMDPNALEELANSIRQQGIIQPLIVRPIPHKNGDFYEIIAGERRWQAAKMAELTEVPVIIRHIPDEAAIAIALIENIQRENLNPIEEAIALNRLITEFSITHQEVAKTIGKSRTSVTNLLRLLSLPEEIKIMLATGELEMGHARALLTLAPSTQMEAAQLIISKSLSVRETEQLIRRLQHPLRAIKKTPLNPDLLKIQENLSRQFKLRVAIQCNAKGKGKLMFHYRNFKELNQFIAQFEAE